VLENARDVEGIARAIECDERIEEGRRELVLRESLCSCANKLEGCVRSFIVE